MNSSLTPSVARRNEQHNTVVLRDARQGTTTGMKLRSRKDAMATSIYAIVCTHLLDVVASSIRKHPQKNFYIWQYRSAMNSWELPYYDHTFLVSQRKKTDFQFILGMLGNKLLTYGIILPRELVKTSKIRTKRQKSEWVNENPYAKWNPSFHPYTRWKSEQ